MSEAVTADLATPRYTDSRQIRQGRHSCFDRWHTVRRWAWHGVGTQTNKAKTRDHHPRNRQEGCQITSLFYENVVSTVRMYAHMILTVINERLSHSKIFCLQTFQVGAVLRMVSLIKANSYVKSSRCEPYESCTSCGSRGVTAIGTVP